MESVASDDLQPDDGPTEEDGEATMDVDVRVGAGDEANVSVRPGDDVDVG
jgi:hypothetical protein